MPFFLEAHYKVSWFLVLLGYFLVVVGASVGGVIALLLHCECLALAAGTLASIFALLIMDSSTPQGAGKPSSIIIAGIIFLVVTVIARMAAGRGQAGKAEQVTHTVVAASIGSLLIIASLDLHLEHSVVHDLGSILRGEWDQLGCKGGCKGTTIGLGIWPVLTVISSAYQVG